jgi:hypothetical protein
VTSYYPPLLKNHLKGRHFGILDNIQKGTPAEAFQHCYEQWKERLPKGTILKGITLFCKNNKIYG